MLSFASSGAPRATTPAAALLDCAPWQISLCLAASARAPAAALRGRELVVRELGSSQGHELRSAMVSVMHHFTFSAALHDAFGDNELVEVVNFVESDDHMYGARWLYHAPGSGFFLDLGRTVAVATHGALNALFGNPSCPCFLVS